MKPRNTILNTTVAALVGCLFAVSAHADLVSFTGSTAGGPTFNRPTEDGTALSSSTTNYSVATFTVSETGTYSVATAGAFDTMTFVYSGVFNPAAPTTNVVGGNDDLNAGIRTSGVSVGLTAGQTYSFVTTSAFPNQTGSFANSITGPGTVTALSVPTPAAGGSTLVTVAGTTTGGPTYRRATDDGTQLSDVGTDVAFKTIQFTVGSVGTYAFLATGDFDTFLSLYAGAFDPTDALTNFVTGNDDAFSLSTFDFITDVSSLGADLVPGVIYTLVTSAFASDESGLFSESITGPGAITLIGAAVVPEPDVLALMMGGLAVAGYVARRRRKA
jgi:hypothetical protein